MNDLVRLVRNAFGRTADRISGQHVPITGRDASVEPMEYGRSEHMPVDVLEDKREVMILADAPGAFPDNTRVQVDDELGLTIHVRRAEQSDRLVWGEPVGTDWYTAFSLPPHLDGNDARATVNRGVLKIRIPKRAMPAPVSIPVTAG